MRDGELLAAAEDHLAAGDVMSARALLSEWLLARFAEDDIAASDWYPSTEETVARMALESLDAGCIEKSRLLVHALQEPEPSHRRFRSAATV